MVNNISLGIGLEYINTYELDYNWNRYKKIYYEICKENNLEISDCVIFGIGGEEYNSYNRGSDVNRVCVSDLIGEKINASSLW